jgi:hypothetical protein
MTQPRDHDRAAIERRDEAQRRLWPITATTLAGGVVVTAAGAGLAWMTAPGRATTSTSTSTSTSSSTSSSSTSSTQLGPDSLQPSDQLPVPSDSGDGLPQAVTGGS